jgi:hypothetical protein
MGTLWDNRDDAVEGRAGTEDSAIEGEGGTGSNRWGQDGGVHTKKEIIITVV